MSPDQQSINVAHLIQVLQFVTSIIIVPGTFLLIRTLREIRDRLGSINGSVVEINQWRADHESLAQQMDRNAESVRQHCQDLHLERMANVNARVGELWERIGDRRRNPNATD